MSMLLPFVVDCGLTALVAKSAESSTVDMSKKHHQVDMGHKWLMMSGVAERGQLSTKDECAH